MTISLPAGILPVVDLTTEEILYGSRESAWRFDLLNHDTSTGEDTYAGILDGVTTGALQWSQSASVKGSGSLTVVDLETAQDGYTRIADVDLVTTRIRPTLEVTGLPDLPFGVFIVTAAPESWADTGRTYKLELHEKTTVLDQDAVAETYTADTSTAVLAQVQTVISSAGEAINVDADDARTLSAAMVWPAGTTKLKIVNDLLAALNYFSLWSDQWGALQATPYVVPVNRSIGYELLTGLDRELLDGDASIYTPDFTRDLDSFNVPNKVITVAVGTGSGTAPLTGEATNTDSGSPYSYAARGNRWIVNVVSNVQVPDYSADPDPTASTEAFLNAKAQQMLIAASSPTAAVTVKFLPIPARVNNLVRFRSTPAGVDARHVIQTLSVTTVPTGLMTAQLQQVVDL